MTPKKKKAFKLACAPEGQGDLVIEDLRQSRDLQKYEAYRDNVESLFRYLQSLSVWGRHDRRVSAWYIVSVVSIDGNWDTYFLPHLDIWGTGVGDRIVDGLYSEPEPVRLLIRHRDPTGELSWVDRFNWSCIEPVLFIYDYFNLRDGNDPTQYVRVGREDIKRWKKKLNRWVDSRPRVQFELRIGSRDGVYVSRTRTLKNKINEWLDSADSFPTMILRLVNPTPETSRRLPGPSNGSHWNDEDYDEDDDDSAEDSDSLTFSRPSATSAIVDWSHIDSTDVLSSPPLDSAAPVSVKSPAAPPVVNTATPAGPSSSPLFPTPESDPSPAPIADLTPALLIGQFPSDDESDSTYHPDEDEDESSESDEEDESASDSGSDIDFLRASARSSQEMSPSPSSSSAPPIASESPTPVASLTALLLTGDFPSDDESDTTYQPDQDDEDSSDVDEEYESGSEADSVIERLRATARTSAQPPREIPPSPSPPLPPVVLPEPPAPVASLTALLLTGDFPSDDESDSTYQPGEDDDESSESDESASDESEPDSLLESLRPRSKNANSLAGPAAISEQPASKVSDYTTRDEAVALARGEFLDSLTTLAICPAKIEASAAPRDPTKAKDLSAASELDRGNSHSDVELARLGAIPSEKTSNLALSSSVTKAQSEGPTNGTSDDAADAARSPKGERRSWNEFMRLALEIERDRLKEERGWLVEERDGLKEERDYLQRKVLALESGVMFHEEPPVSRATARPGDWYHCPIDLTRASEKDDADGENGPQTNKETEPTAKLPTMCTASLADHLQSSVPRCVAHPFGARPPNSGDRKSLVAQSGAKMPTSPKAVLENCQPAVDALVQSTLASPTSTAPEVPPTTAPGANISPSVQLKSLLNEIDSVDCNYRALSTQNQRPPSELEVRIIVTLEDDETPIIDQIYSEPPTTEELELLASNCPSIELLDSEAMCFIVTKETNPRKPWFDDCKNSHYYGGKMNEMGYTVWRAQQTPTSALGSTIYVSLEIVPANPVSTKNKGKARALASLPSGPIRKADPVAPPGIPAPICQLPIAPQVPPESAAVAAIPSAASSTPSRSASPVTAQKYLQALLDNTSNTESSTRLLRILLLENVDLESGLGMNLLDLALDLRRDGKPAKDYAPSFSGMIPATPPTIAMPLSRPPLPAGFHLLEESKTAKPTKAELMIQEVLNKLNDHSEMLNAIAQVTGVDLLENDDNDSDVSISTSSSEFNSIDLNAADRLPKRAKTLRQREEKSLYRQDTSAPTAMPQSGSYFPPMPWTSLPPSPPFKPHTKPAVPPVFRPPTPPPFGAFAPSMPPSVVSLGPLPKGPELHSSGYHYSPYSTEWQRPPSYPIRPTEGNDADFFIRPSTSYRGEIDELKRRLARRDAPSAELREKQADEVLAGEIKARNSSAIINSTKGKDDEVQWLESLLGRVASFEEQSLAGKTQAVVDCECDKSWMVGQSTSWRQRFNLMSACEHCKASPQHPYHSAVRPKWMSVIAPGTAATSTEAIGSRVLPGRAEIQRGVTFGGHLESGVSTNAQAVSNQEQASGSRLPQGTASVASLGVADVQASIETIREARRREFEADIKARAARFTEEMMKEAEEIRAAALKRNDALASASSWKGA